jgi:hypothetical protein
MKVLAMDETGNALDALQFVAAHIKRVVARTAHQDSDIAKQ